jgi:long-chain acyl-CoA synthetase
VSSFACISPREVEEALYAHAMVAEATVLGLPDPVYGEQVVAFVVLRDQSKSQVDVVEELLEHCRVRLAKFKVPAHIKVLHDMPKNAVGKIAKRELIPARGPDPQRSR